MKNYYFILGLTIYASELEIKQAYRRLALRFHPDKNPSAEAESIFKEINEAYEILGDIQKKHTYDQLLKGIAPVVPMVPTPHRDPRYKPRPPGSFSRKSKRQELLEVMNDNLKYAILISRATLLFAMALVVDFTLPSDKTEREVLFTSYRNEIRNSGSLQLNLKDGVVINLNRQDARQFKRGTKIIIYRSSLFDVPIAIENEKTHFKTKIPVAIYGNFIFCPIIMLITSLLGVFYWKGVEFRFNLGVVNFFLAVLTLLFLRIHFF